MLESSDECLIVSIYVGREEATGRIARWREKEIWPKIEKTSSDSAKFERDVERRVNPFGNIENLEFVMPNMKFVRTLRHATAFCCSSETRVYQDV